MTGSVQQRDDGIDAGTGSCGYEFIVQICAWSANAALNSGESDVSWRPERPEVSEKTTS